MGTTETPPPPLVELTDLQHLLDALHAAAATGDAEAVRVLELLRPWMH
jgi:hypothetical protein